MLSCDQDVLCFVVFGALILAVQGGIFLFFHAGYVLSVLIASLGYFLIPRKNLKQVAPLGIGIIILLCSINYVLLDARQRAIVKFYTPVVQALGIEAYIPTYVPLGYRLLSVRPRDKYVWIEYYNVAFTVNRVNYAIQETRALGAFDPAHGCNSTLGWTTLGVSCFYDFTTPKGTKVYYRSDNYFTQLNNTRIVLPFKKIMTPGEVARLIDSMEPVAPENIPYRVPLSDFTPLK